MIVSGGDPWLDDPRLEVPRPLNRELGSTIRGTGVKGLPELGSRDVALFSTVQCNVALIHRIRPSRREKYWVSDPGTGVAHLPSGSASRGVRDSGTLHGFRWWPVTRTWWLAPVNVARSRRRRGWLAPVNSAPSPSSPLRRKVQRFRFGVPCRGSCSWPRSRVPVAMVKCNVRPGCTVGADRSMVCTVHNRSCPASRPHPAPRRARQQTRSLAPVRFRRFQAHADTVCTVHAGTLHRRGALSAEATVHRCTLRLTVCLRRSSGTRNAW